MVTTKSPRKGSLQFWPRKRVSKFLPSVNWDAISEGKGIKGFIAYKAGMASAYVRDNTENSMTKGKDIVVPIDDLYAINRRKIDSIANRYFFVENPVEISFDKIPVKSVKVKIHPEKKKLKSLEVGDKLFVSLKDFNDFKNKEVRLMHLFNVKLDKKARVIGGDNKSDIQKIHWVSKCVETKIMMPSGFYAKGFAEENIKELKKDDIIQFERFGFCKYQGLDKKTNEYEFWYAHD